MGKFESAISSNEPTKRQLAVPNSRNAALVFCVMLLVASSSALWGQDAKPSQPSATETVPTAPHADDTYIIGDDDELAINVWKETELTRSVTVRSDGKISLPLVGDVQAAGRTPAQLQEDLKTALVGYITDPQVTVIVQQINSRKFNILGEINKPGSYALTTDTTIVDAIALAGGLKEFAKKKDIYIIRQGPDGREVRVPFNYQSFIKGKRSAAQNIQLQPHDTVVVP